MTHPFVDEPGPPDRNETPAERHDRNWNELRQELRVTQTGIQIRSGFLPTLPFQSRFTDLPGLRARGRVGRSARRR